MFTKADYLNYLFVLSGKERDMLSGLNWLLERISDETLAEQLRKLLREKQESHDAVNEIFTGLFGLAIEQRRYKRDPALGDAKLRNLASGKTIDCRCIDISLGGLCVEVSVDLPQGVLLAVEVRFFESRRPVMRRGTVRWCSRSENGQYRAGIEFASVPATHIGEAISEDG